MFFLHLPRRLLYSHERKPNSNGSIILKNTDEVLNFLIIIYCQIIIGNYIITWKVKRSELGGSRSRFGSLTKRIPVFISIRKKLVVISRVYPSMVDSFSGFTYEHILMFFSNIFDNRDHYKIMLSKKMVTLFQYLCIMICIGNLKRYFVAFGINNFSAYRRVFENKSILQFQIVQCTKF